MLLSPAEFSYTADVQPSDADQNGLLTMDEVCEIYRKQFNGRDKNKDGVFTVDAL
jgi:hypothetical protein